MQTIIMILTKSDVARLPARNAKAKRYFTKRRAMNKIAITVSSPRKVAYLKKKSKKVELALLEKMCSSVFE